MNSLSIFRPAHNFWLDRPLALSENLHREDLNPVEETEGILALLGLKLNPTTESVIALLQSAAHPERESVDNVIHSKEWQSLLEVFNTIARFSPESFRTNRLPLLKLPIDISKIVTFCSKRTL